MTAETKCGYTGKWAYVDLTNGSVDVCESKPHMERKFLGGRGLQACLLAEHLGTRQGPITDPLGPENRMIIGCSLANDTRIHTAGRGSASFFSPMTRSVDPLLDGHPPVYGLATHSSIGGSFANKLKKAGFDQVVLDGRAAAPVRLEIRDGAVTIVPAEPELFETIHGVLLPKRSTALNAVLKGLVPGKPSSSLYVGPAGWNLVPYACLTSDGDRNFGRGGAGAVLASKNVVAVSVSGARTTNFHDKALFDSRMSELDAAVEKAINDPEQTASFRPETGTTWWLSRAFDGQYLGDKGGYLPWHNYDEGHFAPEEFARVSTEALLARAGKPKICSRCRGVLCSRLVTTSDGQQLPRPEFETAGLLINCGITEPDQLTKLNHLCNEVGLDTMTTAAMVAGAMDLNGKGLLDSFAEKPSFGDGQAMAATIEAVAYKRPGLGTALGQTGDAFARAVMQTSESQCTEEILWCVTNAYAGLGYASIGPKAFDSMFTCYATSNRGRGDHTYAWTVQAEEAGLRGSDDIAATVAASQWGKAVVDSLGICDFFPADTMGDIFLDLIYGITGNRYSADELLATGKRTVNLERMLNQVQGRTRQYDAYVPKKFTVPYSTGPRQGRKIEVTFFNEILSAYYREQGWDDGGVATEETLHSLGLEQPIK